MKTNGGNGRDDPERKKRIDELERQVDELTGGEMAGWKSPDLSPELEEEFLQGVVAYESAPWTTHSQQLQEAGVELPDPETLDDEKLTAKLWEVIEALARMRVFLQSTNHLSGRELYTLLWSDVLHEEVKAMVFDEFSAWHLDLIGSGSDEDIYLWMKYYADEKTRRQWMTGWPDYEMPGARRPALRSGSAFAGRGVLITTMSSRLTGKRLGVVGGYARRLSDTQAVPFEPVAAERAACQQGSVRLTIIRAVGLVTE